MGGLRRRVVRVELAYPAILEYRARGPEGSRRRQDLEAWPDEVGIRVGTRAMHSKCKGKMAEYEIPKEVLQ